jgi:DNA uptake protein ComE-like DNA-binding protein
MLLIIAVAIFLPFYFSQSAVDTGSAVDTSWLAAIEKLETKPAQDGKKQRRTHEDAAYYQYDRHVIEGKRAGTGPLFYFDPNTASPGEWEKLGLNAKTIETIQHYVSKGGRFRKPEDLGKIYSLRRDEFRRLEPFIRIKEKEDTLNTPDAVSKKIYAPAFHKPDIILTQSIDINTADTTQLIRLPGIGSKLAARIIHFRSKLGGFYRIDQVRETFGLPDSTFQKIRTYFKLENITLNKININTASADQLKVHPYFKYNLVNAIILYRNEHGPFAELTDLKKIMIITDEVFEKISPYLVLND